MRFNSKLHKLKKYSKAIQHKIINQNTDVTNQTYSSLLVKDHQNNPHQTNIEEPEQQIQDFQNDQNFNMSQYLEYLSEEQRQLIKQYNPEMPPIYFMTKKQKKRYFDQINNNFKKSIQKAPQRKSKNKKNLKFKNQFQIKYFRQAQKVTLIKAGKKEYQSYQQQIHFS